MSKKPEGIPEDVLAIADDVRSRVWSAMHDDDGRLTDNDPSEIIARAILAAVEAEREACAAIIDATMLCTGSDKAEVLLPRGTSGNKVGLAYAAAIRNRREE